jgi:hypothetical protein
VDGAGEPVIPLRSKPSGKYDGLEKDGPSHYSGGGDGAELDGRQRANRRGNSPVCGAEDCLTLDSGFSGLRAAFKPARLDLLVAVLAGPRWMLAGRPWCF